MPEIKINNETLTFNNIYYVDSVNGNDNTGVANNIDLPFKSVNYVSQNKCASSGDAIYALPGTHDVTYISGAYDSGGLTDYNKAITFIGRSRKTVFLCDGTRHAGRDTHCIQLQNSSSKVYNIIFDFKLNGRTANYATAVCSVDSYTSIYGSIYNCVILVDGSPGMSYANSGTCYTTFNNCLFITKGNFQASYTGGGAALTNCACNKAFYAEKTRITCLENIIYDAYYYIISDGWINTGTGTDPDGSTADIGVYGGPYAWISIEIRNLSISPAHMWYEDIDTLTLIGEIVKANQAQYKVLAGDVQVYPSEGFTPLQDCPVSISIPINKQDLLSSGGELTVIASDGSTEVSAQVFITIEDIDTLTFDRIQEPVDWVLSDVINTEFTEEGFKFKEGSEGEFYAYTNNSGQVKTKGKRTINQILVDCTQDTSQVTKTTYDMQNPQVVGEGKMFEFDLDLTKDMINIQVGRKVN